MVLPLASTGTVVSSPCSRSAAKTWASTRRSSGSSTPQRTDLIGQRRQADRHAFPGIAFGLPVQRLVLAELLEQDHRQQARTGPAAGDDVERRRRLADLLAVAAGDLLAHVLDHLPLARDHLQRLGDVLAELAQPRTAAACAGRRSGHDHPLARQMLGEGLAGRPLAGEGRYGRPGLGRGVLGGEFVLGGGALELLELQLHLIEQPRGALRARAVEIALQLLDLQLLVRDQRLVVGLLGANDGEFGALASNAACSASISSGSFSGPPPMP